MSIASKRLCVLIVACALGLSGCGSSSKADESGGKKTSSSSSSSGSGSNSSASPAPADQAKALKAYVAAGQSKIPALLKTMSGVYSDIDIEAKPPGTILYRYVYARQVDQQASLTALKKQAPTLRSSCKTATFPDMANAGITTDRRVTYIFLNADKSKIWSYTCKPS